MRLTLAPLRDVERVVALMETPLTPWDNERFGLPVFQAAGLRTQVWDLSPLLRPGLDAADALPATRVATLDAFRREIAALPARRTLVLSFLSYGMRTWACFRALSRANLPYAVVWAPHVLPADHARESPWHRLRRLRPRPLAEHLFSLIRPSLIGVAPPRLVLAACGSNGLVQSERFGPATEVVPAHMHDYDIYLACRNRPTAGFDRPTAVFLDEYLPFHPDYERHGRPPDASPEEYFPSLNRFFATLEMRLGLRVVVAAHPRSQYEHTSVFAGRSIVKGRTAELVRAADLVLAHASTSVNFAVLFAKPIVFISSDALDRSPMRGYIHMLAEELSRPLVNVDHAAPDAIAGLSRDVAEPRYAAFVDRYLKVKGTSDKPCWQLLVDRLKG